MTETPRIICATGPRWPVPTIPPRPLPVLRELLGPRIAYELDSADGYRCSHCGERVRVVL